MTSLPCPEQEEAVELVESLKSAKDKLETELDAARREIKKWMSDVKNKEGGEPTNRDKDVYRQLTVDYKTKKKEYAQVTERLIKVLEERASAQLTSKYQTIHSSSSKKRWEPKDTHMSAMQAVEAGSLGAACALVVWLALPKK